MLLLLEVKYFTYFSQRISFLRVFLPFLFTILWVYGELRYAGIIIYTLQTAYDYFCDEFENMLGAAFGIAPAAQGLGETQTAEKDLLRNTIQAIVNKVYLDRYLEAYQRRRDKETVTEEKRV